MLETIVRDLRIGLRVLIKEKSFCALAVVVLALGICGVTTMFSVVNGVMLRGFSFPNSSRLTSVELHRSVERELLRRQRPGHRRWTTRSSCPQQTSFELLAAYLNGSTVNVSVNGRPQRYTGAYTTENFLRVLGVSPLLGRDFTRSRQQDRCRQGRDHRLWRLAARLRRRQGHRRQRRPHQREGGDASSA